MIFVRPDAPIDALAVGRVDGDDVVVTATEDGTITRWDAATGEPLFPPLGNSGDRVSALLVGDVDGEGRVFAVGTDGDLVAWDPQTALPVFTTGYGWAGEDVVLGRFRDRPALFVTAGQRIVVLAADTGRPTAEADVRAHWGEPYYDNAGNAYVDDRHGHDSLVSRLAFASVDGDDLLASSDGETHYLRHAHDGHVRTWLRGDPGLCGSALAIGLFVDRLVVANPHQCGEIWLHDADTGHPTGAPLTGHGTRVTRIVAGRWHGRDAFAAAAEDCVTIRIWPGSGPPAAAIDLPREPVGLAVCPHTDRWYVSTSDAVHRLA